MMTKVLVIAKDPAIAHSLAARLPNQLLTEAVSTSDEAREKLHARKFDLIIYDAESSPSQRVKTLQLLAKLARKRPETRAIVISDSDELHAPAGLHELQWLERPLDEAQMLTLVSAGLPGKSQADPAMGDSCPLFSQTDVEGIMAISLPMRLVLQQAMETAAVDAPVLITGETAPARTWWRRQFTNVASAKTVLTCR